jgi:hypothetical protein
MVDLLLAANVTVFTEQLVLFSEHRRSARQQTSS